MRASDLPDEERAAHYEQVQRALEHADEMLDGLAARNARRRVDGTEFEERHHERQRQESERVRQAVQPAPARPAPTLDPARLATRSAVFALAEEVGEVAGKLGARVTDLEARLMKSEEAAVELILELERRLTELERRLPPPAPRLVRNVG